MARHREEARKPPVLSVALASSGGGGAVPSWGWPWRFQGMCPDRVPWHGAPCQLCTPLCKHWPRVAGQSDAIEASACHEGTWYESRCHRQTVLCHCPLACAGHCRSDVQEASDKCFCGNQNNPHASVMGVRSPCEPTGTDMQVSFWSVFCLRLFLLFPL